MRLHKSEVLAELSGSLMSVDSGDVEVGDIVFLGGSCIRRVWTKPRVPSIPAQADPDHYYWQGLALDAPTDGSVARYNYQMPIGQKRLIFRPAPTVVGTEPDEVYEPMDIVSAGVLRDGVMVESSEWPSDSLGGPA
jgi:hypothetical protein